MPGGIEPEMKQPLKKLDSVVKYVGVTKKNDMKVTGFQAGMNLFVAMRSIYSDYFDTHKPTHSCLAVKALPMNTKFEIKITAYT